MQLRCGATFRTFRCRGRIYYLLTSVFKEFFKHNIYIFLEYVYQLINREFGLAMPLKQANSKAAASHGTKDGCPTQGVCQGHNMPPVQHHPMHLCFTMTLLSSRVIKISFLCEFPTPLLWATPENCSSSNCPRRGGRSTATRPSPSSRSKPSSSKMTSPKSKNQ